MVSTRASKSSPPLSSSKVVQSPKTTDSRPVENNQKKPANRSGGGVGGARPGSGRPKGVPNKNTAALQAAVAASGETPLQFMLKIMRGEACPENASPQEKATYASLRFEAAKAAAPYVHSRLSSIETSGTPNPSATGAMEIPADPVEAARSYKELMGGDA